MSEEDLQALSPTPETAEAAPDVPVHRPGLHVFGSGELVTSEGRGVKAGRPYGEQLEDEQRDVNRQYRFWPGAADRLSAVTRRALGR